MDDQENEHYGDVRLPTLADILHRRSKPPVCLYNFYTYLRDRERSQKQLDFWLDVVAHENMCRLYVKDVLRVQRQRNSVISMGGRTMDTSTNRFSLNRLSLQQVTEEMRNSALSSPRHSQILEPQGPSRPESPLGTTRTPRDSTGLSSIRSVSATVRRKLVSRNEVRKSAERLYHRYIVPGAPKEIPLPEEVRFGVVQAVEVERQDDPAVFAPAKRAIFTRLQHGPYPRFLHDRLTRNIQRPHATIRLILGLIALFIGFTTALSLIFLDRTRALRAFTLIPLWVGTTNLAAFWLRFSPALALLRRNEASSGKFSRMRDPFIISRHLRKALLILLLSLLVAVILVAIFLAVPGHRL
ncbi:MAG: RGS domain-containing protein [Piptocephalis tieghemiana]|nr:MAG: RGS domain-containing protein [Piptocephalis tieghemiana]